MRCTPTALFTVVLSMSATGRAQERNTEILWDTWGVPHIFADDAEGAFFAFGWSQMHSHGDLILRLYGQSRGRAAEYWGPEYLETDRWVRSMGVPDRAKKWYEKQTPSFRRNLDAFAQGINAYAKKHAKNIAEDVKVVLPVSAIDALGHTQRVIHFTFVVNPNVVRKAAQTLPRGSNAWAVGPTRSASGNALLLQNPHLPWSGLFMFYEGHIVAPGIDAYGSTLVGFPVLAIAFNEQLGWSHTVNPFDGADLFKLTLAGEGYEWDGATRPFDASEQVVRVREPDGKLRENRMTIRRSVHGPVVHHANGKALSLRVVGLESPRMLNQWWDMARATNIAEFQSALRQLHVPMFNVVYADRAGHILYLFGGRVPRRSQGDVAFWSGIVPGNSSKFLWNDVLSYEELPRLVDPPTGWIQNANDPPWTATWPEQLKSTDFPSYLSPEFMHFRAQRSAELLDRDSSITFEELLDYKHSTRMHLADRVLEELIPAARELGAEPAMRGADVLSRWDRKADADSRGAVLFYHWVRNWTENDLEVSKRFRVPWSKEAPRTTPVGLVDAMKAAHALERATKQVEKRYGSARVAWGDVFRVQYGGKDLPANGSPGDPFGIIRSAVFAPSESNRQKIVAGDTYYAAIEFSDPLKAKVLTSYGNATQAHSRHVGDQLELFVRKQMRPVWRTRSEIEEHLESREEF